MKALLKVLNWFAKTRDRRDEAYLAEAQNIADLEQRMRKLEEQGKGWLFP